MGCYINIRETKVYVTRSGRKAVILRKLSLAFDHFQYAGVVIAGDADAEDKDAIKRGRTCWWSGDGLAREKCLGGDCGFDIVKAVTPKVSTAGPWKARTMRVSTPTVVDPSLLDILGAHARIHGVERRSPWLSPETCCCEPTAPTHIAWEEIPEEYCVVAMDRNGNWFAYDYVPRPLNVDQNPHHVNTHEWSRGCACIEGDSLLIPNSWIRNFSGHWHNSVFIRPGSNPRRDYEAGRAPRPERTGFEL